MEEKNYTEAKKHVRLEYSANGEERWEVYSTLRKYRKVNGTLGRMTTKEMIYYDWERVDKADAAKILGNYGLTIAQFVEMQEAETCVANFERWAKDGCTVDFLLEVGALDEASAEEYRIYLAQTETTAVAENDGTETASTESENPASLNDTTDDNADDTNDTASENVEAATADDDEESKIKQKAAEAIEAAYHRAQRDGTPLINELYAAANYYDGRGIELSRREFIADLDCIKKLKRITCHHRAKMAELEKDIEDCDRNIERKLAVRKIILAEIEKVSIGAATTFSGSNEEIEQGQPEQPIDSNTVIAALGTLAISALAALFNVVKAPAEKTEATKPATVEETPIAVPVEKTVGDTSKDKLDATREKIAKTRDVIKKNTRRLSKLDAKVHGLGTELDFYEKAFNTTLDDSALVTYSEPLDELTYIASQISHKLIDKAKAELTVATLRERIAKATARLEKLFNELVQLESKAVVVA